MRRISPFCCDTDKRSLLEALPKQEIVDDAVEARGILAQIHPVSHPGMHICLERARGREEQLGHGRGVAAVALAAADGQVEFACGNLGNQKVYVSWLMIFLPTPNSWERK